MSVKIMTAVWAVDLPHADKIVLLALADNANDDGYCYPSSTTIARKCGMAERSVRRVITRLAVDGHITVTERPGRSCTFLVHPGPSVRGTPDRQSPGPKVTPDPQSSTPDPQSPPPRTVRPNTPDRQSPITIIEPSIEPSRNRQSHEVTRSVFEHWQREWNHPTAKLDPKRTKRIEARLKDFSAEQLCSAISGFKHSAWHNGTDPKGNGTVYDSIDTLLRDNAQVEKGMSLFAHPPRPPPKPETAHDRMQRLLNGDDSRVIEHDPKFPAISGR